MFRELFEAVSIFESDKPVDFNSVEVKQQLEEAEKVLQPASKKLIELLVGKLPITATDQDVEKEIKLKIGSIIEAPESLKTLGKTALLGLTGGAYGVISAAGELAAGDMADPKFLSAATLYGQKKNVERKAKAPALVAPIPSDRKK